MLEGFRTAATEATEATERTERQDGEAMRRGVGVSQTTRVRSIARNRKARAE